MDKLDYCVQLLGMAKDHFAAAKVRWTTCANAHSLIMGIDGFGSFLAAQVVADLKNTKGHPLTKAKDWHTFSAPGPGSLRGLGWVIGHKITPALYQDAIAKVHRTLPTDVRKLYRDNMQDLQNCLCEFDKMMRVRTGTGRSKRKYHGEAAWQS